MSSEKFCLRWNEFETNISDAFRELREEKDFFDVTLACDDSQIEAHKVIISACSPFFRNVLRRNPHQHPLLYLKGVKYKELLSVLNFMYMGEVNIAQDELNSFLAVAEDLRVKGLTQNASGNDVQTKQENPKPEVTYKESHLKKTFSPPKRPRPNPPIPKQSYHTEEDDDIQEVAPVKSEPHDPTPQQSAPAPHVRYQSSHEHQVEEQAEDDLGTIALDETYGGDEGYDYQYEEGYDNTSMVMPMARMGAETGNTDALAQRDVDIAANILKDTNQSSSFICLICQFKASSRHKVFCHIESKHFQDPSVTYSCPLCDKTMPSRSALGKHVSRNHKGEARNSIFPKESY